MTAPTPTTPRSGNRAPMPNPVRAWSGLTLGTLAQVAVTFFVFTPAFLIPMLHTEQGVSLAEAGLLAAAPTFGVALTLIAWGALADRIGEKWVIVAGLALTSLATVGAIFADGYLALGAWFLLGGMAAASANAASGRVVVGWFPKDRRGLAMGIRQMGIPLGTTLAAVTIPTAAHAGIGIALLVPLVATSVVAVACLAALVDPPRPPAASGAPEGRSANPYRASSFLWRIHLASALLVVPQITLAVFGLVWLIAHLGWAPLPAGIVIGVSQLLGALGRLGAGVLSDRVGSRVRPLRWVSVAAIAAMLLLAAFDALQWNAAAAVMLVLATMVSVADNGIAYTSVAEAAGPRWAGRALGTQNTGQYLTGTAVAPIFGALIGLAGYPLTFAVAAIAPALAIPIIPPRRDEQDRL